MQWIIDILGIACLVLAGMWVWFRKKHAKYSKLSLIAFFVTVVITMILAYFLKH
jgi:hypothetical protein